MPFAVTVGTGVPLDPSLRPELESTFRLDLAHVRVHRGNTEDALAHLLEADAFASGAHIFLTSHVTDPTRPRARYLYAHEVCHVFQQADPAAWGVPPDIRLTPRHAERLEKYAHRVAQRFVRGQAVDGLIPRPSRSPRPMPPVLQCHESYEHRLLGDTPTSTLTNMINDQSTQQDRDSAIGAACKLLDYLLNNATSVDPGIATTLQSTYSVRSVQLKQSQLYVTYGELCTLADYFGYFQRDSSDAQNPQTLPAVDELDQSVILPILQAMRLFSYNSLNARLSSPSPGPQVANALLTAWPTSIVAKVIETEAFDLKTQSLGLQNRDHYSGLLARNACHFAPFTWYRWRSFYQLAQSLAAQAHQQNNDTELTRRAWIAHGYAEHFLHDSFAAGHLANKTLIMQWFVDWAGTLPWWKSWLFPVWGWDQVKNNTPALQPGLSGMKLYTATPSGTVSNDPQTAEEATSYQTRMAATQVQSNAQRTQQQAYSDYLAMLSSPVCQYVTGAVHDAINASGITVFAGPQTYLTYGDDHMLDGGTGPVFASQAAQLSQQSLIATLQGNTPSTADQIQALFPTGVVLNQTKTTLQDWHSPNGPLQTFCQNQVFDAFATKFTGSLSYVIDMGVVSVDQAGPPSFNPGLGPDRGSLATGQRPELVVFQNTLYVFWLDGNGISYATFSAGSMTPTGAAPVPFPANSSPTSNSRFAATVFQDKLALLYCDSYNQLNAVRMLTFDGTQWSSIAVQLGGQGTGGPVTAVTYDGFLFAINIFGGNALMVTSYDGTNLTNPGNPAISANVQDLSAAVVNDLLYLGRSDGKNLILSSFDGTSWKELGGIGGGSAGDNYGQTLSLANFHNYLVCVYPGMPNDYKLRVVWYTGLQWEGSNSSKQGVFTAPVAPGLAPFLDPGQGQSDALWIAFQDGTAATPSDIHTFVLTDQGS